jgi:hypothetical protein
MLLLYLTADSMASNERSVNDELERMRKEAVVT